MADDTTTPKAGATDDVLPQDIAKNNADVKSKLESQDINGQRNAPQDELFGDADSALDKLRDDKAKKAEEDADTAPPKADDKPVVEPKPDAGKPAADKPAADKPAADKPATDPKTDELFKDVQLPPGARAKSAEAFAAIKLKASQEIESREKEIARLKGEVEAREAKLKDPVPKELQEELKQLREFRAKFDIEADPKFKSFDESVNASREFVYAQLAKNPNITKDVIDAIKKYGGPENVKMEKIYEAMQDPTAQRLIESRIGEIEQQKFNKEQAQALAKKNVAAYIEERQKEFEAARTGHNDTTRAELDKLRDQLPWMKKLPVDEKATEEQKKGVEAHNAFVDDVNKQLDEAIKDDSPNMRAVMLAGMAQLFYVRDRYQVAKARLEELEKANAELTSKLEKFKGAAVTRLDKSAAPSKDTEPLKTDKESDIFNTRAGDSLDSIRARIIQEQARASAS